MSGISRETGARFFYPTQRNFKIQVKILMNYVYLQKSKFNV